MLVMKIIVIVISKIHENGEKSVLFLLFHFTQMRRSLLGLGIRDLNTTQSLVKFL